MTSTVDTTVRLADPKCQIGAYIRKGNSLYRVHDVNATTSQVQLEHAVSEKRHWRNAQSIFDDKFILVRTWQDAASEAEISLT